MVSEIQISGGIAHVFPAQALQVREQAQGTVYTFASGARVTVFTLEDGTEALLYENPTNGCRKLYYNHVLAELGVGEFRNGHHQFPCHASTPFQRAVAPHIPYSIIAERPPPRKRRMPCTFPLLFS